MYRPIVRLIGSLCIMTTLNATAQTEKTFAERLGWPEGARVVIFHSDDAGMSHSSNVGTIESIEKGVVTSASTMMPCGWVPEFAAYLKDNPEFDNGLHLTLTSEWSKYRWPPLAGQQAVPGLVDKEGAMWKSIFQVAQHASPDEIEMEIRAQVNRAETMGMPITHLDTHMGTVFATMDFLARYIKVGVEKQIPIMIPGGHLTHLKKERGDAVEAIKASGVIEQVWDAGLPVLDDLIGGIKGPKDNMADNLIDILRELKPGITQIIVHATRPTDLFKEITSSGGKRKVEMETMCDPRVRACIEKEGIILTTWRELKQRRDAVKK
jgi:chitin disaccharide deacetylase